MNEEKNPRTLTLNKEFKRAYYQGKSKATPYFVFYKIKNRSAGIRYGITTSKKLETRFRETAPEEFCERPSSLFFQGSKTTVIMSWWPGQDFEGEILSSSGGAEGLPQRNAKMKKILLKLISFIKAPFKMERSLLPILPHLFFLF